MERRIIATDRVASTGKPYSQAIRYGDLVFVSGQVAWDASTQRAVEGGIEAQTRRVLDNLTAILEAAGSSRDLILKTTCFLADIADAAVFNEVYREYFPDDPRDRRSPSLGSRRGFSWRSRRSPRSSGREAGWLPARAAIAATECDRSSHGARRGLVPSSRRAHRRDPHP